MGIYRSEAWEEGRDAYHRKQHYTENPYRSEHEWDEWDAGWMEAERNELLDKLTELSEETEALRKELMTLYLIYLPHDPRVSELDKELYGGPWADGWLSAEGGQ